MVDGGSVVGASERRLRVLFAEDDSINRYLLSQYLGLLGHDGLGVGTGVEALEVLRHEQFDLVLLDIHMPGLDGVQTARSIRAGAVPSCPRDIPLIATTAYAMRGDRERFIEAGMDDYLPKPFTLAELGDLLRKWARQPAPRPSKHL